LVLDLLQKNRDKIFSMNQDLAERAHMPASMEAAGTLVVYGDFSCPMCYLASQGVDALTNAGIAVQWRAVEHRPDLPVGGLRHDVDTTSAVERSLGDARALLRPGEQLPATVPALVPRTMAAVSAYAEACGAEVKDEIRRLLFSAYWEGADIGNPTVLHTLLAGAFMRGKATSDPIRESGYAVAVTGGPITSQAWRLIRGWQQDWQALGAPELPSLWDGTRVKSGERAVRQLAVEVSQASAPEGTLDGAGTRARVGSSWRPPTTVCPPASWVSQVGDPWRRAFRMSH
jgi:predicted DsbA family dithiol-disulfide isomerase